MSGRVTDDGLSEVIGFILIIAILVIIASLYVTYVVPAQGRDAEIEHLNYIKGQFQDYKISTDSLWINKAIGNSVTQSIILGTQQEKTTGGFSGFMIMDPVGSGGVLEVNSGPGGGRINVTANESEREGGNDNKVLLNQPLVSGVPINLNTIPSHLFLEFNTNRWVNNTSITLYNQYNLRPSPYGIKLKNDSTKTEISIFAVPRFETLEYRWELESLSGGAYNLKQPSGNTDKYYGRDRTDLTLSIKINGNNTMQNYTVYQDIWNFTPYFIDLMDPSYGLSANMSDKLEYSIEVIPPDSTFNVRCIATKNSETYHGWTDVAPSQYFGVPMGYPMGYLNYTSRNYYYNVQQGFYYKMGGIFVNQSDGSSSLILPSIALAPDSQNKDIVRVSVNCILINGMGKIGGASPVQITTTLENITASNLSKNQPNAEGVNITIYDEQFYLVWRNIFNSTIESGRLSGLDETIYQIRRNETTKYWAGLIVEGTRTDKIKDIILDVNYVNLSVALEAVGKSVVRVP